MVRVRPKGVSSREDKKTAACKVHEAGRDAIGTKRMEERNERKNERKEGREIIVEGGMKGAR